MCVIAVCETKDARLSKRELKQMGQANSDGWGLAWPHGGKVEYQRGLTTSQVIHLGRSIVDRPLLLHARIATVGAAVQALTHPFPCTRNVSLALRGKAARVLAHNGHWFNWEEVKEYLVKKQGAAPAGAWSDTRVLAWLEAVYGIDKLHDMHTDWAGLTVTLDGNGALKYRGSGWETLRAGVKVSNKFWQSFYHGNFYTGRYDYKIGQYEDKGGNVDPLRKDVPYQIDASRPGQVVRLPGRTTGKPKKCKYCLHMTTFEDLECWDCRKRHRCACGVLTLFSDAICGTCRSKAPELSKGVESPCVKCGEPTVFATCTGCLVGRNRTAQ